MDSKTMLARENFIDVLLGTIKAYYQQVHGKEVELSLHKQKGYETLYLYHMPLFVSKFPMSKGAKSLLYTEYNIRGSFLKYIIGKLGVFVISNSFGLGAANRIYIRADADTNTNLFISPCNRTVRFYDFKTDTVDCILKAGYQSLFLNNQLDFRENCSYAFVPKVLKRGENWYSEPIMHGHALARVRDRRLYEKARETVWEYVARLTADTLELTSGQAYFRDLRRMLGELCEQLLEPQDPLHKRIDGCIRLMEQQIGTTELSVPTCISHGDLQEGNIWVTTDQQVLIYDWETCGRRSVWYDPATLCYSLHNRVQGFALMGCLQKDDKWLSNDPNKQYTVPQLVFIHHILLLEDILFQMQEALQLTQAYSNKRAKEVLSAFAQSVEEFSYELKE